MGVQTNLVKKRVRNGSTRWVIDFYYVATNGERTRYVRFAEVQNRVAAEREALERYERALKTGDPEPHEEAPRGTLSAFYESDFKTTFLPTYRPNTRERSGMPC